MKYIKILRKKIEGKSRNELALMACFTLVCLIALVLRFKLISAQTFDYTHFLQPWYKYLDAHGLHAFHKDFANYNTPYLLLLWFTTHLHIGALGSVKGISICFDLVLAATVALVVSHYRPNGYVKYAAFATTLFVPTVLLNSGLWGQCDSIYTSFLILSFYAVLKDRGAWAWILLGVAFGFKLQAIFFIPFLIFVSFYRRWKWFLPVYAILTFIVLSIFPVFEGRSIASVAQIYVAQTLHPTADLPMLSWFSPTFGQLLPSGGVLYNYFKLIMLAMAAAVSMGVISLAFIGKKFNDTQLLLVMALSLFAIPFLLPGIHERYMYSAEIASVICAFVIARLAWVAVVMQIVSIITYNSYFTGANQPPQIAYSTLSLVVLGIIYFLGQELRGELSQAELPAAPSRKPYKG